jgi:monoterpene epsilon-lactone hydrolase
MHSWQFYSLETLLNFPFKRMVKEESDLFKVRRLFETFSSQYTHPEIRWHPTKMGKISAEILSPRNGKFSSITLYLHGGGYFMGSPQTHRSYLSYFSYITNSRVYVIDYRLAPEHPFPAALQDAVAAYNWLTEIYDPQEMIIAGESAGGGLTLAALGTLKLTKAPLPSAAVCISPWTDLALTGPTLEENKKKDSLVPLEVLPLVAKAYLKDTNPYDPLASPLYSNLEGLPPLYLQVSNSEVLFSDAVRFAQKAEKNGVQVTLDVWEGMTHAWPFFARFLPESREALKKISSFINKNVSPSTSHHYNIKSA